MDFTPVCCGSVTPNDCGSITLKCVTIYISRQVILVGPHYIDPHLYVHTDGRHQASTLLNQTRCSHSLCCTAQGYAKLVEKDSVNRNDLDLEGDQIGMYWYVQRVS